MKILYVPTPWPDYLCDLLAHGLSELAKKGEVELHIFPRYRRLYVGGPTPEYGRGFVAWNNIEPTWLHAKCAQEMTFEEEIDFYTDMVARYELDYVVFHEDFGRVVETERDLCWSMKEFQSFCIEKLPSDMIVFVDGRDHIDFIDRRCVQFKREGTHGRSFPISFSIPEKYVVEEPKESWIERKYAKYVPGMPYMFDDEESYLDGYRTSAFAHTRKKAGWDCLRHYEIMSQGCIPIFEDIGSMPRDICTNLPRSILEYVWMRFPHFNERSLVASDIRLIVWAHAKSFCTTVAEATRFVDTLRSVKRF